MPQFDLFIWFSLSFGTIVTFQLLYYFLLYYIIAPFSNLQKTLIKLYNLKKSQKQLAQTSLFEHFTKIYFQKIKLKKENQENILNLEEKKTSKVDVKPKTVLIKKKLTVIAKKNSKNFSFKKKDLLLKNLNLLSNVKFIVSKKKVQKKIQKKILKKKLNSKKVKKS